MRERIQNWCQGWVRDWMQGWIVVVAATALLVAPAATAQVATTTVQDTVYHADGTPAGGTVLLSWNAFTTSDGDAVPASSLSVAIGTSSSVSPSGTRELTPLLPVGTSTAGSFTVALAPNAGATPMGSYYTAVFHLDDGTVSREYWVVPATVAGGGAVTLAQIRNQVLPASVAMQTVSKQYVDTAIAVAVSGHPLDSSPYVLKAGDTMAGPLVLPADPVSPNQAADKHYVDTNVSAVAAGLSQAVTTAPSATQVVTQPTGTQLEVNILNGELNAQNYLFGSGNNGISNALSQPDCANGCAVHADQQYTSTESVAAAHLPALGRVQDDRGGSVAETFLDPLNPTAFGASEAHSVTLVATRAASAVKAEYPSTDFPDSTGLRITHSALTGGSNQYPTNVEVAPYFKSTYSALKLSGSYNTPGQHVLNSDVTHCYGVGDCLMGAQFVYSSGGLIDGGDEGAHPFDQLVAEDSAVFAGTCASGCVTGSTTVTITATASAGTEGEGRFLIDTNPAKVLSNGTLTGYSDVTPLESALFTGTSFPVSTFLFTAAAATSQATNIAPGTVTLPIKTTGAPTGYATSTAALPASSGIACIDDGNTPDFEMAPYTVIDAMHIQLTLRKAHPVTSLAVGGLCGYGLEQTVDTANGIRQLFPVLGSTSATSLFYVSAQTPIVGASGRTSAYLNLNVTAASIARTGGVVSVTTAGNLPADVNGLTLTISGVADSSYNGNFAVTTTGPNTLTYADSGPDSTSSGGTLTYLTGGYRLYPLAEVIGAMDAATKTVDGVLTLAPNLVAWATGDSVEEPHYFQALVRGDTLFIQQQMPRPTYGTYEGKEYDGIVGPGVQAFTIRNTEAANTYFGNGGTHSLPDYAFGVTGPWRSAMEAQAGDEALFRVHCNSHGCGRWSSNYYLFELDSNSGVDTLTYQPQSSTATWRLGSSNYSFSPSSFTAGTINVGTLNATTITGGISGAAITTGTISAARLPVFGPSGATHASGAVPDPGATAGNTRFLREDGVFAVPAGTGGGGGATGTASITGGTIDNTVVGATAPAAGNFTTGSFTGNVLMKGAPPLDSGNGNPTIDWGEYYGSPDLYMYNGGAGARYGWGLKSSEMQFFLPGGAHYSFNSGGDLQTSGTNELMRLTASTGALLLHGGMTAVSYHETLTTPASSSAACSAGDFTDDANYHYVCVATNTWKRVALSSF